MSLVRTGLISSMDQKVSSKYYENYDRIFGEFKPSGRSSKITIHDKNSTLDNKESSISKMMRDKVMVRMIREGKVEDRGLKREAEHIERENSTRPKEMFRKRQQERLHAAMVELKRSQR